jgi:hypothetical protein
LFVFFVLFFLFWWLYNLYSLFSSEFNFSSANKAEILPFRFLVRSTGSILRSGRFSDFDR